MHAILKVVEGIMRRLVIAVPVLLGCLSVSVGMPATYGSSDPRIHVLATDVLSSSPVPATNTPATNTPTTQPTVTPEAQATATAGAEPTGTPTLEATGTASPGLTITPTAGATPTDTRVPVNFSIDGVRLQRTNRDGAARVTSLRQGNIVYLFIYWTVTSLPAGVHPTYRYAVVRRYHGKVVGKRHDRFRGVEPSYPPGQYVATFNFRVRHPGKYTFTGSVGVKGVRHSAQAHLTVKPK